ncbi:Secreted protein OS=Streptomyces glaucescens OX=1907 GN=SGLAU_17975 PE=4 SV=1 [Streptomyces glaucescens]
MFTPTLPRLGPPGPFPRAPLAHPLDRKWLHYFLSRCGRQALIANLSVLGSSTGAVLADPGAPATGRRSSTGTAAEGQHMAILLAYEEGHGWSATQFNAEQPDLPWSAFRLPHPHGEPGTFRVAARSAAPAAPMYC